MTDRPTPETDAEHAQFAMGGFTLDFCRKLERERDEARMAFAIATDEMVQAQCRAREANCKMADALQEVDLRTLDFERMKQERDEAREALEYIAHAGLSARHIEDYAKEFLQRKGIASESVAAKCDPDLPVMEQPDCEYGLPQVGQPYPAFRETEAERQNRLSDQHIADAKARLCPDGFLGEGREVAK